MPNNYLVKLKTVQDILKRACLWVSSNRKIKSHFVGLFICPKQQLCHRLQAAMTPGRDFPYSIIILTSFSTILIGQSVTNFRQERNIKTCQTESAHKPEKNKFFLNDRTGENFARLKQFKLQAAFQKHAKGFESSFCGRTKSRQNKYYL